MVEPSSEISEAYLHRSEESLSSAKTLLKAGNLRDSVALSYFSMYHCLLSALFRIGIKSENHAASIILLKELFGIDNRTISKAKEERVDKQYYVDYWVSREEAILSVKSAEDFITEMNSLIAGLNDAKIKEHRKNAECLFL
jgi:uncharacterized protein (UPF0332 family)